MTSSIADRERLPRACAAHLDRAGEGVPEPFELLVAATNRLGRARRCQPAFGTSKRTESPGSIAQHRREVAREVAVQVAPLERDLVDHRMRSPSTS